MSKEIEEDIKEIEQAKSNILRGIDIESSALILEKAILDGYIFTGGRIDTLKLATRQILYFIENSKVRNNIGDKDILDYVKENVKLKEENETNKKRIEELEEENSELKIKNNFKIVGTYAEVRLEEILRDNYIPKTKVEEIIQKLDIERNKRNKRRKIEHNTECDTDIYSNTLIAYEPETIKAVLEELLKDGGEYDYK